MLPHLTSLDPSSVSIRKRPWFEKSGGCAAARYADPVKFAAVLECTPPLSDGCVRRLGTEIVVLYSTATKTAVATNLNASALAAHCIEGNVAVTPAVCTVSICTMLACRLRLHRHMSEAQPPCADPSDLESVIASARCECVYTDVAKALDCGCGRCRATFEAGHALGRCNLMRWYDADQIALPPGTCPACLKSGVTVCCAGVCCACYDMASVELSDKLRWTEVHPMDGLELFLSQTDVSAGTYAVLKHARLTHICPSAVRETIVPVIVYPDKCVLPDTFESNMYLDKSRYLSPDIWDTYIAPSGASSLPSKHNARVHMVHLGAVIQLTASRVVTASIDVMTACSPSALPSTCQNIYRYVNWHLMLCGQRPIKSRQLVGVQIDGAMYCTLFLEQDDLPDTCVLTAAFTSACMSLNLNLGPVTVINKDGLHPHNAHIPVWTATTGEAYTLAVVLDTMNVKANADLVDRRDKAASVVEKITSKHLRMLPSRTTVPVTRPLSVTYTAYGGQALTYGSRLMLTDKHPPPQQQLVNRQLGRPVLNVSYCISIGPTPTAVAMTVLAGCAVPFNIVVRGPYAWMTITPVFSGKPVTRLVLRDPIQNMPPKMLETIAESVAIPDEFMPKLQRSFGLAISRIAPDKLGRLPDMTLNAWCKQVHRLEVRDMFCRCDDADHCRYMHYTQEVETKARTYMINSTSRLHTALVNAVNVSLAPALNASTDANVCTIITAKDILPTYLVLQNKFA